MTKPKGAKAGSSPQGSESATRPTADDPQFPIVGIGASAGGLAAFEAFFAGMPADRETDMAFVLVQHLDPEHKSMLAELIGRTTPMPVLEVEDGMVVRPNSVYIIPPNTDMALSDGALRLFEPTAPRGQRLAIDHFFRSLADELQERAICIVLSGTGSDGTEGLRAIKAEGGMAMAQTPESTEFSGMPSSALATGLVDYTLPPAEMPAALLAYAEHAHLTARSPHPAKPRHKPDDIGKVLVLLRARTGNDFTKYKMSTVARRIDRRMAVNQITRIGDYVRYLQMNPTELDALFGDLLIGVTSFFRDPDVFAELQDTVIPQIIASKDAGGTIRVWVPACSTGEEAYSLAIVLREQMEAAGVILDIKIFATDIDGSAIERARAGTYPVGIGASVSERRLERFFTRDPDGDTYRVNKGIRDMLVFAVQSVTKDPPFSRLDLVSCRNLLIYLNRSLQDRLIPLFHYALKPGGFLLVGTSESAGGFSELFSTVSAKHKIYQRTHETPSTRRSGLSMADSRHADREIELDTPKRLGSTVSPLRELIEQELLTRTAPAAALVNHRGEILYLHGRTGRYLEPSPGKPGANILKMAREGLSRILTAALRAATTQSQPVVSTGVRVKTNGAFTMVDLTVAKVERVSGESAETAVYLVMFEDSRIPAEDEAAPAAGGAESQIELLNRELQAKEDYLQTTFEEMETSNEELQSTNEELQSTNEELETSKEELQSVNEELATVNAELQQRVLDLSRANNDMNNLLAGTGIGTIFVDSQLRIQRFTPAATDVVNLIPSDVGRPVGHIMSNLIDYDSLEDDARKVIDTLEAKEQEVQSKSGKWYLLRIRPYRTLENVIDGAALTFTEITELKKTQLTALLAHRRERLLATVVADSNDAVLVWDLDGRIRAWNARASRMYGWTEEEALAMNMRDLIPENLRDVELETVERLARSEKIEPYGTHRITSTGQSLAVTLTATALVDESGTPYGVATTERGA